MYTQYVGVTVCTRTCHADAEEALHCVIFERMHPDNTIDPRGGTGYVTSLQISQNAMYIQMAAFTIARDGHIMKW